VLPVVGDRVVHGGTPGPTVAQFVATLAALVPTPAPTPPPDPAALAARVREAPAIALVTLDRWGGVSGAPRYTLRVARWVKRPAGTPRGPLVLQAEECQAGMLRGGDGPLLLFFAPQPGGAPDQWQPAGDGAGVFRFREGRVVYSGLPGYGGWSTTGLLGTIRTLLR
jgi:hypothetical protein